MTRRWRKQQVPNKQVRQASVYGSRASGKRGEKMPKKIREGVRRCRVYCGLAWEIAISPGCSSSTQELSTEYTEQGELQETRVGDVKTLRPREVKEEVDL
ncbi:hypothetical protein NDU88_008954 [Pleurodeles waltl]|uniref:Uncharacterized protein n=1 Tax=Pleurodeles waltl TaxID=8319 RepID=A0AAV7N8R4_PLEWA|nr:hypothetical protein NDU88_008954 [Pleurodeles waltl]